MAFSKSSSIRKAQIPSLCHLCEESSSIQWKCVDCNLLMCSKCKTKVHSKFKSADDHDIISLKEIGKEQTFKLNLQNISCRFHQGQKVCLYCKNCNELACPNCVSDTHKKHDLESLSKIYEEKTDKLKYLRDELNADLYYFLEDAKRLEKERSRKRRQHETTKQAIRRQTEELKKAVEREAAKKLQELDTSLDQTESCISSALTDNLRSQEEILSNVSTLDATLNKNDMETIIEIENNMATSWINRKKTIRQEFSSVMEFYKGKVNQIQISEMLGSLRNVPAAEKQFTKLHSYETDFGIITNAYPTTDGHILVCDEHYKHSMKEVKLVDKGVEEVRSMEGVRIFDVTEIKRNEFIVSFVDKTILKRLTSDGTFHDLHDLSPLLPRALHFTKSGKLLLGLREQGEVFPVKSTSQRKLIVMDLAGRQIHEYQWDDQNKRLFSLVSRVTTVLSNELYVIDRTSNDEEGRVIALSYPNKIVWKYDGHASINTDPTKSFHPRDIITADNGNIVVLDTNIIHILNAGGSLLNYVKTKNHGIIFPSCFAVDITGLLWVGCSRGKGEATNAMVHIVKFEGF